MRFFQGNVWASMVLYLFLAGSAASLWPGTAGLRAQGTDPGNGDRRAGIVAPDDVTGHLAAGEFAAARRAAQQLPPRDRQRILGQVAAGQAVTGDPLSAARSLATLEDASVRDQGIADVRRGAGGGTMADFSTLMNLIQTTVTPDTWDTLGGPSSMFPYPGGIYVDGEGLLQETVRQSNGSHLESVQQMLRPDATTGREASHDWTRPSTLRCVSLRRLAAEWVRQQSLGHSQPVDLPDPLRHMAGLSEIRYVMFDPEAGDIVLAGPCGGIDRSDGWTRDRANGNTVMQLSTLMAALRSAQDRQPFGCSIDPTQQAIADSLAVAAKIQQRQIPLPDAADAMRDALGQQSIRVFGIAGDQPLAWLLLEADRHMKQLALGQHPLPAGATNYLQAIERHLDEGVPNGQLLRLWFTGAPLGLRSDAAGRTFELSGMPVRLARENQIPNRFGGRQNAPPDIRSANFVASFNKHFSAIADRYPLYSSLVSVYRAAAVGQLIQQHAERLGLQSAYGPLTDSVSGLGNGWPIPRQVESIAVLHTVRRGSQRHHVLVASGGVWIEPSEMLAAQVEEYPSLEAVRPASMHRPAAIDRWWWDADGNVDTAEREGG